MPAWEFARLRELRAVTGDGVAMSFAPLRTRSMVLVELTADGMTGYGESWTNHPPWATIERMATLADGVLPLLPKLNPDDPRTVQRDLLRTLTPLGRQWGAPGPIRQAVSGVDIALWDRDARCRNQSVAELVGPRVRDSIPVYASSLGPEDVIAQARRCLAAGHRAVKVKVGFTPERDEHNLRCVRDIIGERGELYADANQAWTLDEAVAMAPVLQRYGVGWIEEPVRGDRLTDLTALHERTGLRIATGENLYGLEEFLPYLESSAIAVLQPDLAKTGGLTEVLDICAAARETGTAIMPHLYGGAIAFAATLQLAAVADAVAAVEYDVRDNPLRDPLLATRMVPVDGRIEIPRGPGLGVSLSTDAVEAVTTSTIEVRLDEDQGPAR